jgi:hypothetical protein
MLVATRDPPLHSGASGASHARPAAPEVTPRFSGLLTALQIAGSLLAIPVGLASGYSIYHANFSAEARCQSLRGNIISMIDKNADASTLRILARRDVTAFEATCAEVDPDTVAAFKTLFAVNRTPPAPAQAAVQAAPAKTEASRPPAAKPQQLATPAAVPQQPAPPAAAETKTAERSAPISDAAWLDAVRHALIHTAEPALPAAAAPALAETPAPAVRPLVREPAAVPAGPAPLAAPALPPPSAVAVVPPPAVDDGHPVPPAPIVGPAPVAPVAASEPHTGSRLRRWIAQIPLVGRSLAGPAAD